MVVVRQVEIQVVVIIINIVVVHAVIMAHIHGGRGCHHHVKGTFCETIKTRMMMACERKNE